MLELGGENLTLRQSLRIIRSAQGMRHLRRHVFFVSPLTIAPNRGSQSSQGMAVNPELLRSPRPLHLASPNSSNSCIDAIAVRMIGYAKAVELMSLYKIAMPARLVQSRTLARANVGALTIRLRRVANPCEACGRIEAEWNGDADAPADVGKECRRFK